eukprot:2487847-Rhodomonas_salina.1
MRCMRGHPRFARCAVRGEVVAWRVGRQAEACSRGWRRQVSLVQSHRRGLIAAGQRRRKDLDVYPCRWPGYEPEPRCGCGCGCSAES